MKYVFRYKDGSLLINGWPHKTNDILHKALVVYDKLEHIPYWVKDYVFIHELEMCVITYNYSLQKYYKILE